MKTKPQRTKATCLLLRAADKLLLKPYKWLIGRCGRNLLLISLSLYKGSVSEHKEILRRRRSYLKVWTLHGRPESDACASTMAFNVRCALNETIVVECGCMTRLKVGEKMAKCESPPPKKTVAFHLCFFPQMWLQCLLESRHLRELLFSRRSARTCVCFFYGLFAKQNKTNPPKNKQKKTLNGAYLNTAG